MLAISLAIFPVNFNCDQAKNEQFAILHNRLNLDLGKSFVTARKRGLKLVKWQSLVVKCCKIQKV